MTDIFLTEMFLKRKFMKELYALNMDYDHFTILRFLIIIGF